MTASWANARKVAQAMVRSRPSLLRSDSTIATTMRTSDAATPPSPIDEVFTTSSLR